jgi:hypothetical protein
MNAHLRYFLATRASSFQLQLRFDRRENITERPSEIINDDSKFLIDVIFDLDRPTNPCKSDLSPNLSLPNDPQSSVRTFQSYPIVTDHLHYAFYVTPTASTNPFDPSGQVQGLLRSSFLSLDRGDQRPAIPMITGRKQMALAEQHGATRWKRWLFRSRGFSSLSPASRALGSEGK